MPFTKKILKGLNQCELTDIEHCQVYPVKNVKIYKDRQGRIRLLKSLNGYVISSLFIEKYGKKDYIILGVYTLENHRRKGHAKQLFHLARKRLGKIRHSELLSPDGEKWAFSVENIKGTV